MQGNTTDTASRVFAANRARGAVAFEVHASDGVTRRGDLHESGSLRVRFPSPEAEGLSAVFVNTAGGIAGGDRFDIDIAAREGARLTVEVVREAIPEAGRPKLPRVVASDKAPAEGPDLLATIRASGVPVRTLAAHQPDDLEAAGWSEVLDEALDGEIAFAGGALRMSPAPAMTLFDVDGPGATPALAVAAATAVAEAIVRHDLGG